VRLDFGEALLNRIEIGGVGWQEPETGIASFDGLANTGDFMTGEVISDDNIAR
jgi:hypothetical protein